MKKQKQILLVEDDKIDVLTIKKALKELEIQNELSVAEDGEQALAWLEAHRKNLPGLILLDLNMPKINGLELLKILKEDPVYKVIPVVILTTSEDDEDRLKSFELSVAGYMIKPYRYEDFLQMMEVIKGYWRTSKLAY
ncbi:MAG: response regulator [Bacteroidota bacterium]